MNILAIDVGTYSVKILEFTPERKKLSIINQEEILLSDIKKDLNENLTTSELQHEILKAYFEDIEYNGKVIQKVPAELITTRFITLPINNKRKAEAMIPFQLDESLPFSVTDAHYTADLMKIGNNHFAILNISQKNSFGQYYNEMLNDKILPTHLYGALSAYNSCVPNANLKEPYCIVDIGHSKTKAYFVKDKTVASNHTSYFGGKAITEVIAETYQISKEDAEKHKHENSFFLTDNQLENVTQDQKDFAAIMKQTIFPLVTDLKRWELGFRVQHGSALERIYITGGTAVIENIDNFLSQAVGVRVERLPSELVFNTQLDISEADKHRFTLATVLAHTQIAKLQPSNFLKGSFASGYSDSIPVHSAVFIATRLLIVSLILSLVLIADTISLGQQEKKLNRSITKLLKTPSLELSPKDRRLYKSKPAKISNKLIRKEKAIKSSIKVLSKGSDINAILPLSMLSTVIGQNSKVDLTYFQFERGLTIATFKAFDVSEFTDVKSRIEAAGLDGLKININEEKKELNIEFKE